MSGANKRKLLILHFNDVYNIDSMATRFASKVNSFRENNPLVLFSGDCFNPSMMSTITRGDHMVPVLNALGVELACLGNHDLDFGLERFEKLVEECSFRWLVSNINDKDSGKPLGGLFRTVILEWAGVRLGVMGLVENEWLSTLTTIDEGEVEYIDFVAEGQRLAQELKTQGAEVVIALTHMRLPNDMKLLQSVPEIDVVMGGHDHGYHVGETEPHGNLLVKSGTDFRDLTSVWITVDGDGGKKYECTRHKVTSETPEDPEMVKIVQEHVDKIGASLDDPIGETFCALDGRFAEIRTKETSLGNFVCDVLRATCGTDIAFLNSGTFRSDKVHPKGVLTKRDLVEILPMVDDSAVLELTGEQMVYVLENSVSQYPKLEGRFLQISGLKFEFDSNAPPGSRVVAGSVVMSDSGEELDPDKTYTACTKAYLVAGKDGFDVLTKAKVVIDAENSPLLPSTIRNHFKVLEVLNRMHEEMVGSLDLLVRRFVGKLRCKIERCDDTEKQTKSRTAAFHPGEHKYMIAPITEGRIVEVGKANGVTE